MVSDRCRLALVILSVSASSAFAQGLGRYGMWADEPRAYRVPPPPPGYVYAHEQDYRPPRGYRYQPRETLPWARRRDRDAQYDYGARHPSDDYDGFDTTPPGYSRDPYAYGQDNRPFDDGALDGPADEGQAVDGQTVDGGARPEITPLTPPLVAFYGSYTSGSIVIDVGARKLYFVNGDATAYAYPIGVGRQGFSWTGTEKISRIAEWPDWHPPKEMRERKPELPVKMTGGLNNPLGARAIYLGNTLFRVHGTNDPKSIGRAESSGCFRMLNEHVAHLASLAQVGAEVTVVKSLGPDIASAGRPVR